MSGSLVRGAHLGPAASFDRWIGRRCGSRRRDGEGEKEKYLYGGVAVVGRTAAASELVCQWIYRGEISLRRWCGRPREPSQLLPLGSERSFRVSQALSLWGPDPRSPARPLPVD
jgi:hypothetical protein